MIPGEILPGDDPVVINAGVEQITIVVENTSRVPIHLTAHMHVFEANPRLRLDRERAFGMRPDVPADGSIRIAPGQTIHIPLVPIAGARIVRGFNGAIEGPLAACDVQSALERLVERGFLHEPEV